MNLSPTSDRSRASAPSEDGSQVAQGQTPKDPDDEETDSADAPPPQPEEEEGQQSEAEETDAPEADGQEADAEGGRAPAALVTDRKKKKKPATQRLFLPKVVHERVVGITIREDGKDDVEVTRPAVGDRSDPIYAVWNCYDKQRKRALEVEHKLRAIRELTEDRNDSADGNAAKRRRTGANSDASAAPTPPDSPSDRPAGQAVVVDRANVRAQPHPQRFAQFPAHLRPVPVGVLGDGRDVDPETPPWSRWQTKPLDERLQAEICAKWFVEITEHTQDLSGRTFVPAGLKNASYCGSFPHAICKPKLGPRRDKQTYLIGASHDVNLRVNLMRRPNTEGQKPVAVSECEILELLRSRLSPEEVAAWGSFESSLVWYTELQFARSVADSSAAKIVTDPTSGQCAFSRPLERGSLLLPPEAVPYSGGYYEQQMHNGVVDFQLKIGPNVTSCNLREQFHARQFRFAFWTLNPYLNGLECMRATTLDFSIKNTLHNDLKRSERWVERGGPNSEIIPCPLDHIPSIAPPNRRKRKSRSLTAFTGTSTRTREAP